MLAFIIYDISSEETFNSLPKWIEYLNSIEKMKIIICGNKIDLNDRKVNKKDGEEFANKMGFPFFETSAKNNENIENMFYRSIVELPYFEGKYENENKDELVGELLNENKNMNNYEILNMNKKNDKLDNNEKKKNNDSNKSYKIEEKEVDNKIQRIKNNSSNIQDDPFISESNIHMKKKTHVLKYSNKKKCPC